MKNTKVYKRCPKQRWWKDEAGAVISFEPIGGEMNIFRVKGEGKEEGCYVIGATIHAGWTPITEEEYNRTEPKSTTNG